MFFSDCNRVRFVSESEPLGIRRPTPSGAQVLMTEHFINMLIFIVEFLANRNVFYLKHGIILYIYALLCPPHKKSHIDAYRGSMGR